jgi:fructose-bisphosphate aldolase class I
MIPTLETVARALVAPGKGILAADESSTTMNKRLAAIGVSETSESGRQFRDLLFTAPELERYLSGVILFDATIRQNANDGTPFPHLLERRGILPGIKVDLGLHPLANFPEEEVSIGLDSLGARLDEYYEFGARFTKWRSVIRIAEHLPTDTALRANAHVLARYAALVQEHHMVPMIEPEVLFEGTHTLARSGEVLRKTLACVFEEVAAHRVNLAGLILKTSMALPGRESGLPLEPMEIARETVHALRDTVPNTLAGIVFLSGGQTPVQATANLNAIAGLGPQPWPLTFSYSRAVEEPALAVWKGVDRNIPAAQAVLVQRLKLNALARDGAYRADME